MPWRSLSAELFADEARRAFGFLRDEGFDGPDDEPFRLRYVAAHLTVEVMYDASDGRVSTVLDRAVGERHPRAGLACLYVEARLGPAQDVREIVRSRRLARPVLESHARALRGLLPLLRRDGGDALMLACHGR